MHRGDEVVVHRGGAAGFAVGEDDDVFDRCAAPGEGTVGFLSAGSRKVVPRALSRPINSLK
jgi:hypothetical protein